MDADERHLVVQRLRGGRPAHHGNLDHAWGAQALLAASDDPPLGGSGHAQYATAGLARPAGVRLAGVCRLDAQGGWRVGAGGGVGWTCRAAQASSAGRLRRCCALHGGKAGRHTLRAHASSPSPAACWRLAGCGCGQEWATSHCVPGSEPAAAACDCAAHSHGLEPAVLTLVRSSWAPAPPCARSSRGTQQGRRDGRAHSGWGATRASMHAKDSPLEGSGPACTSLLLTLHRSVTDTRAAPGSPPPCRSQPWILNPRAAGGRPRLKLAVSTRWGPSALGCRQTSSTVKVCCFLTAARCSAVADSCAGAAPWAARPARLDGARQDPGRPAAGIRPCRARPVRAHNPGPKPCMGCGGSLSPAPALPAPPCLGCC